MPTFLGADTAQLRSQADRIRHGAAQVSVLEQRLQALLAALEWTGADSEEFRARSTGITGPALEALQQLLADRAHQLEGQASAQDAASAPAQGAAPLVGIAASAAIGWGGGDIRLLAANPPLGAAAPFGAMAPVAALAPFAAAPQAAPLPAADISDAIGTGELRFPGTGIRLIPPAAEHSVTVGADHDLAPGGASEPFAIGEDGRQVELEPSTRYDVGEHGVYYTDAAGRVAYVEATGGGAQMNPNLRRVLPETTYHVNDSVYLDTDGLGRTEHLYVPEVEHTPDMRRSQSTQSDVNERYDMTWEGGSGEISFDAGHVLARQLGGIREEINYTPQNSDVNQARKGEDTIYTYETMMADGIAEGREYSYETRIVYGQEQPAKALAEGSRPYDYVPELYDVHITEDGETVVEDSLRNYPDGARFDP